MYHTHVCIDNYYNITLQQCHVQIIFEQRELKRCLEVVCRVPYLLKSSSCLKISPEKGNQINPYWVWVMVLSLSGMLRLCGQPLSSLCVAAVLHVL